DQTIGEGVGSHRLALDDVRDSAGEHGARQASLPECLRGAHDDRVASLQQVIQSLGARRDDLAGRRQRLEPRHVPAREIVHPSGEWPGPVAIARVEPKVAGERFCGRRVGRDHQDRLRAIREQTGETQRRCAAAQAGDADRVAGRSIELAPESGDEVCERGRGHERSPAPGPPHHHPMTSPNTGTVITDWRGLVVRMVSWSVTLPGGALTSTSTTTFCCPGLSPGWTYANRDDELVSTELTAYCELP